MAEISSNRHRNDHHQNGTVSQTKITFPRLVINRLDIWFQFVPLGVDYNRAPEQLLHPLLVVLLHLRSIMCLRDLFHALVDKASAGLKFSSEFHQYGLPHYPISIIVISILVKIRASLSKHAHPRPIKTKHQYQSILI
jgi:hypothetical protein